MDEKSYQCDPETKAWRVCWHISIRIVELLYDPWSSAILEPLDENTALVHQSFVTYIQRALREWVMDPWDIRRDNR